MYKPVKQTAKNAVDGHYTIVTVLTGIRSLLDVLCSCKMINISMQFAVTERYFFVVNITGAVNFSRWILLNLDWMFLE